MQRLKDGQSVLVMVQEKMALCTLTGFSDGAAVLLIGKRQHGGPMPDYSTDAQLTFESGPNLVMLNGIIERRGEDELLFSVRDGVQVPPRRRTRGCAPGSRSACASRPVRSATATRPT